MLITITTYKISFRFSCKAEFSQETIFAGYGFSWIHEIHTISSREKFKTHLLQVAESASNQM